MDHEFRARFNSAFSDRLYTSYSQELQRRLDTKFEFRLAETPVFFPPDLKNRLESAAGEIMAQLRDPTRLGRMKKAIPSEWDTPGMSGLPSFTQLDFAVVRHSHGGLAPRLIELQGFPSLTAMQVIQRDVWCETLANIAGMGRNWSCWFSGLSRERFLSLARRTIVGDHNPENVILMDLDPGTQKTRPDFAATRILFGIDAVCPSTLLKQGRRLFRHLPDGRRVPVERIYNRVVFDELARKATRLPFDYREDLDVEWTPHPNWFWTWSKSSLPYLDHPAVPKAILLSELDVIPEDVGRRYVLKPLFSFAGAGVNINPTREDIERVADGARDSWCLQERVEYEPALRAVDGGFVKVEVRLMFLKPDDESEPVLAQNLCRLSRGKMLGVDFNKDFTWVGSSVGLWPE
jgi:hypothetical protein